MTSRHTYHVAKRLLKARREAVDVVLRANTGLSEGTASNGTYRGLAEQHLYNERASRKAERYQRASAAKSVSVLVSEGWNSKPDPASGKRKG